MATSTHYSPVHRRDAERAALQPVLELPEAEALERYARLPSALQWRARKQATGERRALLIHFHLFELNRLK